MAIGYKLIGKPVEGIDASIFTTLSQTLLDQEATREKQRQAWRDEQDALRKSQGELTPTVNQEANQFFGKFSQGIMDVSTTLQRQLETGQISSSEYTAQWRNLNQSNEQMIAAQTSYQETAQKITEDVANGITSAVNTANLNHFNKVFQPGAMEVESDGRGGLRLFNKETGQVVSPSYLSNLTNSSLPKYDYMKVADTLVEQFGKRGVIDAAGNTIKGVYANMKGKDLDTLMTKEAKALLEGSQAPTVSILVDGMGYNVVYSKDELKPAEAGKPGFVYRKPDGTFEFAEADQEKAVVFMKDALKNALPLETKDSQDLTKFQKAQLALQKRRLDQDVNDDLTDLPYISNINVIATEEGSDLAKSTIRGLNKDSLSEDSFEKTTEIITNVFDNQNFPSGAILNRVVGGEVYEPEQRKQTISGKSTLTIPAKKKVDALELFVPEIMTEAVRIPSGKEFAKTLDKIINLLDTRKGTNKPVSIDELIKFFENKDIYERYNPIKQENVVTDVTKKKFG